MPAAIRRDLLEIDLCEKFGWTPNQLKEIPYKWIQKYITIQNARTSGADIRSQVDKFKTENKRRSNSGGSGKFYREI